MEEAQQEANERSTKRSMFDRLSDEHGGPPPPPPPPDPGGDDEPSSFEKAFGKFFKLIKGVVGVLLAVAIPALAFLLNSPVFEKLKEAYLILLIIYLKQLFHSYKSKRLFQG